MFNLTENEDEDAWFFHFGGPLLIDHAELVAFYQAEGNRLGLMMLTGLDEKTTDESQ